MLLRLLKPLHNYNFFQSAYLVFFALLPFLYSESLLDPIIAPRQAFLSLFLAIVIIYLLFKKDLRNAVVPVSRLSSWIILLNAFLVGLSLLSISYAHLFSESIYVASKYAIVFVFTLTTYFLLSQKLIFKEDLVKGVFVFCVISLAYGLYDIGTLSANGFNLLSDSNRITATFGNKNLFASALLLCAWTFFLVHIPRIVRRILLVLFCALLLFLQSKIVLMVMIFGSFIYVLTSHSQFAAHKKKIIAGFVIGFPLLILILLNFQKFVNLSSLHTLDTRLDLWRNSIKMFLEHPQGVGAGNWLVYFPKYGLSHFDLEGIRNGTIQGRQPHNDFIWMLCELGIQGFLAYLLLFALLFKAQLRFVQRTREPLALLVLLTTAAYCLVAFFDFPLERIEHQLLVSVIIAVSLHDHDSISDRHKAIRLNKLYLPALLIVALSLIVCWYRLNGEYFTREAISAGKSRQPELVIENGAKAKSLFYEIDPMSIPVDWYAGVAYFHLQQREQAEQKMEEALKYTPYNARFMYRLGAFYAKDGKRDKAIALYRKAIAISPSVSIPLLK